MLSDPPCPICQSRDFEPLAERRYYKERSAAQRTAVRLRYQVMFAIWAPGEEVFTIVFLLCRSCGLVLYRPRPEADDLEQKYRFLTAREAPPRPSARQKKTNARRSDELLVALAPFLEPHHRRVLDYGGGDGKLMTSLIRERGLSCALVDYVAAPVAGVEHLGDTIEDLPDDARFDVIVCSHVLEHLADPVGVLKALGERLVSDGILFAEVPLEIWGRVPAPPEPVTHVNYFCPTSLAALFERAGYRDTRCWTATPRHPTGTFQLAVQAIGRAADGRGAQPVRADVAAVRRLMCLRPGTALQKVVRHPKLLLSWPLRARRRLERTFPG